MSKRVGNFQLKQPANAKKPKLDIEIVPSQRYNPPPLATSSSNKRSSIAKNDQKIESLWGDEDDEFIVLASQAVEELEMFQQSQVVNGSSAADITFGKFSSHVKTSTQTVSMGNGLAIAKHPPRATDKLVAELFADDMDDIFTEKFDDNYQNIGNQIDNYFNNEFDDEFNLVEFRQEGQKPAVRGRLEPSDKPAPPCSSTAFKAPLSPSKQCTTSVSSTSVEITGAEAVSCMSKVGSTNHTNSSVERAKAEQEAREKAAKKQEHAKDIQVKFLTNRLEQIERKAETLQKDYNEAVEKAQIKDGEVSVLRYELKTVKSTNEQLRLEKIREKETIKKEWVEKLKDLEKVIMAQKVELESKDMEVMNLRTKRLNSTVRSVEPRGMDPPEPAPVAVESFILSALMPRLMLRDGEGLSPDCRLTVDPHVFEISSESAEQHSRWRKFSNLSRVDTLMIARLNALQTVLTQVINQTNGSKPNLKLSAARLAIVVRSCEQAFGDITQYCSRLTPALAKEKEVNTNAGAVGRKMTPSSSRSKMDHCSMSIFQRNELFSGEQAKVTRRFLALLGLLCRISSELVNDTLLKKEPLEQLARDVKLISNSSAFQMHHGMVMGVAAILKGISFQFQRAAADGRELMVLFRSIILCQTDAPSSLMELSEFLRRMSGYARSALPLEELCRKRAPSQSDSSKRYRLKTVSFSDETCTLQMYASLLESSIKPSVQYETWQLKPLLANAENTICFLRNAILKPARWLQDFVDRCQVGRVCELCHIRIVSAFIVLLHRVLLCWHQNTLVQESDIIRLQAIARNGTLLLFDVFHTAYRSKLLRLAGPAIQCRLRIIYNWLQMQQQEFEFQPVHSTALRTLDLRLLINEPLKLHYEKEVPTETGSSVPKDSILDGHSSDSLVEEFHELLASKKTVAQAAPEEDHA
ncbi:uncharacterized protein LOC131208082 [Anopheles bellator]|uniref:uncharacterized protein LOC131208082 n=1 Tax=Anopheles bellator TaxID=139047 RepID=UPI00264714F9|nr:uncharacterized protein LOC131208082 [Anopheles bellator]